MSYVTIKDETRILYKYWGAKGCSTARLPRAGR